MSLEILDNAIRRIPDFPKKGILFYDITGVLVNPPAFKFCLDKMVELRKEINEIDRKSMDFIKAYFQQKVQHNYHLMDGLMHKKAIIS